MSKHLIITFFLLCSVGLWSQHKGCIRGDCENGEGVFEYYIQDIHQGRYEGSFQQGKPHGKGRFIYANGERYEGYWRQGVPNGRGVMITKEGNIKQGLWQNGQMAMQARAVSKLECLGGDCQQGQGRAKDEHGNYYTGSFQNGLFHGFGEMRYTNGNMYQGMWKDGHAHGKGHLFYENGHTDVGLFSKGQFVDNKMKIWALIVGVADYKYYSPLQFTTNDAQRVYAFFRSVEGGAVPEDQIKILLDDQATAFQITNEAATLFEKADSNDLILFYFAGHGVNGGFLPYDYAPEKMNMLHHGVINSIFKDSPAKFKLCVADACHSGSFDIQQTVSYRDYMKRYKESEEAMLAATRSTKSIREKIQDFYKSFSGVKGGTAVILSSSAEEISLEANKLEQGVFSYFFIEALKGAANSLDRQIDNIINIDELYDYIDRNVRSFTYGFQHPAIYGNYDPKTPISIVHD